MMAIFQIDRWPFFFLDFVKGTPFFGFSFFFNPTRITRSLIRSSNSVTKKIEKDIEIRIEIKLKKKINTMYPKTIWAREESVKRGIGFYEAIRCSREAI